jgi:SRSO17 transposase
LPAPEGCARRFSAYMESVSSLFETNYVPGQGAGHARHYLQGLLSELKAKNMWRMEERVSGAKHQNLQQFLSDSPWPAGRLWGWVGRRANGHLGGRRRSMLLIDESGFAKKGPKSAGVARQYNGRLGKTDNCQVGVFSALALETRATLVGARLYLPKEWVEDPARCLEAGIPEEEIRLRTKLDLARELVAEALANGLNFHWVGVDSGYGKDQDFLCWLEDQKLGFVGDVPRNLLVWEDRPAGQTRPENLRKAGAAAVEEVVAKWRAEGRGRDVVLRRGENGPVRVRAWARMVWVWPEGQEEPRRWWLVVREDRLKEVKHTLINAPAQTTVEDLAKLQGGRHFVERTFEDGKSHVGMGDYQMRKWLGWQHHMALVGLALLFVMEERLLAEKAAPFLSVRDVVELMDWYFLKHPSLEEIQAVMSRRHQKRKTVMEEKMRSRSDSKT